MTLSLPLWSEYRAHICKRLWSPGIDSEETILPAYVAGRAGTTKRVVLPARQVGNRFLGSLKGCKIRVLKKSAKKCRPLQVQKKSVPPARDLSTSGSSQGSVNTTDTSNDINTARQFAAILIFA